jgi:predicted RNA-binding protein with PUA domain
LLGDHGPSKSSFFFLPNKLVVTNPAVRRGTAPTEISDPKLQVLVDMKDKIPKEDNIVEIIVNGFLNGSDG